jgi:hypothetical protein
MSANEETQQPNSAGGPLVLRRCDLPVPRAGKGRTGHGGAPHVRIDISTDSLHGGPPALPEIDVARRQLRDVSDDALDAIESANNPPRVFLQGSVLVRLDVAADSGRVTLRPLVGKVLRHHLSRVASWFQGGRPTAPPYSVVSDIEARVDFLDLPVLDAVVTSPVATPGAGLITRPGYHRQARLWYQPDDGLAVPAVPDAPTDAEVRDARRLIEGELLADFPFVEACDRAVAWAALVLPFVRPMIDGPTPLHLIAAPSRGTGKTLLAQALMAPALGRRDLEPMTVDCEEAETRKRLTSCLRNSPTAVLMDNLGQGRRLESSSLASVLTGTSWQDRLLGSSVMRSMPVRCVWLATGNNPSLSDELARRTLRCRLDTATARPHMRTGFKHPELLAWARENRPALLQAVLTLVRAWLAAGRPGADVWLGGYDSWCRVVGGLLHVAGIDGLRRAVELFQGEETDTEAALAPFLKAWWERFGASEVGVKDLYDVAVETGRLEVILDAHLSERQRQCARGSETERSRQTRLGNALKRLEGQVYAGYRIESVGKDRRGGRQVYSLAVAAEAAAAPRE